MKTIRCVICGEPCGSRDNNELYPFCSRRCQLVDLGRWLDGDYRIPGPPLDGGPPGDEDENENTM